MGRRLILIATALLFSLVLFSQSKGGGLTGMTREEFRVYKESYLKHALKLSDEVSAKFFPLYEDYQNQKQANYKKNKELMNRAGMASEAEYRDIIEKLHKLAMDGNVLEDTFFQKAKLILTYEQLFKLGKAENDFQKHILKELTRKSNSGNKH